jgi:hypothetical protein
VSLTKSRRSLFTSPLTSGYRLEAHFQENHTLKGIYLRVFPSLPRRLACLVLSLFIALLPAVAHSKDTTVKVALLVTSPEQSATWLKVATQFSQQYPHIKIQARKMDNEKYHGFLSNWQNRNVDVIYGFAGQRLFDGAS